MGAVNRLLTALGVLSAPVAAPSPRPDTRGRVRSASPRVQRQRRRRRARLLARAPWQRTLARVAWLGREVRL